jgi:hypothetical protein
MTGTPGFVGVAGRSDQTKEGSEISTAFGKVNPKLGGRLSAERANGPLLAGPA